MKQSYASWGLTLAIWMVMSAFLSAQAPVNDKPCNAIALTNFGTLEVFSNRGATADSAESLIVPPVNNAASNLNWREGEITHSVWFTIVAPPSGFIRIDLCNDSTEFDTQIALYDVGNCNDYSSYSLVGANDDLENQCQTSTGIGDIWASILDVRCLIPGNTYYLVVDGWTTSSPPDSTGTIGITVTELPSNSAPLNGALHSLSPICAGQSTGSVGMVITGGQEPYTIAWETGDNTPIVNDLAAGTYTVTLKDACDSTFVDSIAVTESSKPFTIAFEDTVELCFGDLSPMGDYFSVGGGVAVERERIFGINAGNNNIFTSQLDDASALNSLTNIPITVPGVFAGDLIGDDYYFLNSPNALTAGLYRYNTVSNSISFVGLTGARTNVDQVWIGATWDETTGTLYAMLYEAIEEPSFLYRIDTASGAASLIATVSGGPVTPFGIAADTAGTMYMFDIVQNLLYTIDKTTAVSTPVGTTGFNGSGAFGMDFDPSTNQLYMIGIDFDAALQNTKLWQVDVTSGYSFSIGDMSAIGQIGCMAIRPRVADFDYVWTPPVFLSDPFSANPTLNPIVDTAYQAVLTDQCGDQAVVGPIRIDVNMGPELNFNATADNGTGDGMAEVIPTGTGPFTYNWSTGATTSSVSTLQRGIYTVTVTDGKGCSATDSVLIGLVSVDQLLAAGLVEFSIYPNPTKLAFTLDLDLHQASKLTWAVQDLRGTQLMGESYPARQSLQTTVDVSHLPSGIYLLQIQTEQGMIRERLIIR